VHQFLSIEHAREVIEAWRRDYNEHRPHSALGGLTLTAFSHHLQASPPA
jgi:putative transposase